VEKIVLRHADRVIATTPGATESFYQKVRGHCSRNKFICIPNGYDPDDYPETSPGPPCDRLIFSYVGSTGEYISEPALFLRALKRAVDESPKLRNVVRVRLVGAIENRIKKLVERIGLQDIVEIRGNVAHREAIAIMTSSHVLLLFELPVTENRPTLVIPSKVFEYLGSGRLILSMVTDGDTADVLKDCPNSLRISPTDPVQMADTIKELARKFESGTLCKATGSPPPEHTREVRAGKFAEMLHGLYDGLRKTPN
jgi:glycosyltransferase involved in cell wall biosynthesis